MADDDLLDDEEEEDELKQVSHLVPESLREDAQDSAEHGELSEAVRETYRIVAYGEDFEDAARLKQRLERAKNEYQRLVEDKQRIEERMEDMEDRIRQIRDRLNEAETKEEQYEELLEDLESQLWSGAHVFPDHADVERAAEVGKKSENEVINDLRERNPDVPDDAFQPAHEATFEWTGEVPDDT